jgi:hypothetical protein
MPRLVRSEIYSLHAALSTPHVPSGFKVMQCSVHVVVADHHLEEGRGCNVLMNAVKEKGRRSASPFPSSSEMKRYRKCKIDTYAYGLCRMNTTGVGFMHERIKTESSRINSLEIY